MKRKFLWSIILIIFLFTITSCGKNKKQEEVKEYSVSFFVDGNVLQTFQVKEAEIVSSIEAPTKEGYTFERWDCNGVEYNFSEQVSKNIALEAVYKKNEYMLTINLDNGEENVVYKYLYSEVIDLTLVPQKDGYTFTGWSEKIPETMPARDITITAQYIHTEYELRIVYDDGVTQDQVMTFYKGDEIPEIQTPSKIGHKFIGWSEEIPEVMPGNNVTLVAQWEISKYKIIIYEYYSEGMIFETSFKYDSKISIIDPDIDGYEFQGYYTKANGEGEVVTLEKMPAENMTIYAFWKAVGYKLTINYDNGENDLVITLFTGQTVPEIKIPTKLGHCFDKWSIDIPKTMPAKSITISAIWKKDKFTLTINDYNQDNSAYSEIIEYDNLLTVQNPTRVGYHFDGYYDNVDFDGEAIALNKMPANNVVLYTKWSINSYNVMINNYYEDGNYATFPFIYNSVITIENPVRYGYELDYYSSDSEGLNEITFNRMGAEDIVAYANYKKKSVTYTIMDYNQDGSSLVIEKKYLDIITVDNPTRADYNFVEFNDKSDGTGNKIIFPILMLGENTTIYACYKPIDYTIKYELKNGKNPDNTITSYTHLLGEYILPTPTRVNFQFMGWYLENTYQTEVTKINGTDRKNYTFYAKWKQTGLIEIPTYESDLIYNGLYQSPNWLYVDTELMTMSGTIAVNNPGTYTTIFILNNGLTWKDNTSGVKSVTWTINKYDLATQLSFSIDSTLFKTSSVTGMDPNLTYIFTWFAYSGTFDATATYETIGTESSYFNKSLANIGKNIGVKVQVNDFDAYLLNNNYCVCSATACEIKEEDKLETLQVCLFINDSINLNLSDSDYSVQEYESSITNINGFAMKNANNDYLFSPIQKVDTRIKAIYKDRNNKYYYREIHFRAVDPAEQAPLTIINGVLTNITQVNASNSDIGKTYIPTHFNGYVVHTIASKTIYCEEFTGFRTVGDIQMFNTITTIEENAFYRMCGAMTITYIGTKEQLYSAIGSRYIGTPEDDYIIDKDGYYGKTDTSIDIKDDYENLRDTYNYSINVGCLVEGTQIMLADGTTKNVEEITYSDLLLVKDLINGGYTYEYPIWIEQSNKATHYTLITFEDGSSIKVVGAHSFFDLDMMTFVDNGVDLRLGARILKMDFDTNGKAYSYGVRISDIKEVYEEVNYYHIFTTSMFNLISDHVITTYAADYLLDYYGYCDLSNNDSCDIVLDLVKRSEIMSNPENLYQYSDFDSFVPYYFYIAFRGEETKVMVDNGVLTYEEWCEYLKNIGLKIVNEISQIEDKHQFVVCNTNDFEPTIVLEGDTYILGNAIEVEGKTFIGWRDSVTNEIYQANDSVTIYCSTCFIAIYE